MIRAYLPPAAWPETPLRASVVLDEAESKHLGSVMRVAAGASVELLDGAGRIASAIVRDPHRKHIGLEIVDVRTLPQPAPRRVLALALVREQQLDWIIQKAVELGTAEIRLIQTANAVVRLSADDFAKKLPRWTAVALAACKQSGNAWLPVLKTAPSIAAALALRADGETGAFGALRPGAVPYAEWLAAPATAAATAHAVWIGPEGDFTPAESDALAAADIAPVTLGPIVLRVETAALFMLTGLGLRAMA